MILNSIEFYIATLLTFFLFYFNLPYWTGREMAELSSSGIWRAFYRFLSFLGTALFRLCEQVSKLLPLARRGGTIASLVNLLFYIAVLFLLTQGYSLLMNAVFPSGIAELAEGDVATVYGFLQESVLFLRALFAAMEGQSLSGPNVFAAIIVTLLALLVYVVINTLFFSILFGFLQNKLAEVNLTRGLKRANLDAPLMAGVKSFLSKRSIVLNLRSGKVLVLFLLVTLIYSFVMTALGRNELTLFAVFLRILDAIELVPIVISFIITLLSCKAINAGAGAVVQQLPQPMQRRIQNLSDQGNRWVERTDRSRRVWASQNATTPPEPDDTTPPPSPEPDDAPPPPPPPRTAPARDIENNADDAWEYLQLKLERYKEDLRAENDDEPTEAWLKEKIRAYADRAGLTERDAMCKYASAFHLTHGVPFPNLGDLDDIDAKFNVHTHF